MLPFCRPSNIRPVTAYTLAVGTEIGGDYVLAALQDGDPSLPLWIEEATIGLQGDLGAAVRIDGLVVTHHNFAAGTDLRLRVHSAASWGGAVDITVPLTVPAWKGRFAPHLYFDVADDTPVVGDRTRRYFYFDNQDANSAPIRIGELTVVGAGEELAVGLAINAGMPVTYGRSLNPSRAGVSTVHDYRTRQRSWSGTTVLDVAPVDEKALFESLQDETHGTEPFVSWPTGRVEDEPILGRIADPTYSPDVLHMDVMATAPFAIEELSCGEAY